MPTIKMFDMQGKVSGELELNEQVFGVEPNVSVMHLVVRSILAGKRQGTQSTLSRGMVRGGGRKIYRQKGTGNARHHGNRAPQFRHGGVVFAPQPRDYVVNVPRKVRRLAMVSALSSKVKEGKLFVLSESEMQEAKTKNVVNLLKNLGAEKSVLLVSEAGNETLYRASRNIERLVNSRANTVNVYDLLRSESVIMTKAAVENIQEVYA